MCSLSDHNLEFVTINRKAKKYEPRKSHMLIIKVLWNPTSLMI